MLSMQGFVFLEQIIMNDGLLLGVLAAGAGADNLGSYQQLLISHTTYLIQIDVESQVYKYNTTTTSSQLYFKPILRPIFVNFKRNKSICKYLRNLEMFQGILKSCLECQRFEISYRILWGCGPLGIFACQKVRIDHLTRLLIFAIKLHS